MRIPEAVARFDTPFPMRWFLPLVTTIGALWFMFWQHTLMGAHIAFLAQRSPFHLGLWIFLLVVILAWSTLRALHLVGEGSGAGLLLAMFGLLCHLRGAWSAILIGGIDLTDASPGTWSMLSLASFHRNVGLVAFGLGLGLAVASSVLDAVRRRTTPAWTRPEA